MVRITAFVEGFTEVALYIYCRQSDPISQNEGFELIVSASGARKPNAPLASTVSLR
jgi:hypothetical protein